MNTWLMTNKLTLLHKVLTNTNLYIFDVAWYCNLHLSLQKKMDNCIFNWNFRPFNYYLLSFSWRFWFDAIQNNVTGRSRVKLLSFTHLQTFFDGSNFFSLSICIAKTVPYPQSIWNEINVHCRRNSKILNTQGHIIIYII